MVEMSKEFVSLKATCG